MSLSFFVQPMVIPFFFHFLKNLIFLNSNILLRSNLGSEETDNNIVQGSANHVSSVISLPRSFPFSRRHSTVGSRSVQNL